MRDNHVDSEANQFPRKCGKSIGLTVRPAHFDDDVSPSTQPEFSESFRNAAIAIPWSGGRSPQVPDPVDLPRLLRLGGERRGEEHRTRASEERATVDHWVRPQAVCGCGLDGAWGHRVGSMVSPPYRLGGV